MERLDLVGAILGSSLFTWVLGRLLGKKKEDIELALNYQKFYKDLIEDLEHKIEALSGKVEKLLDKETKQSETIEQQRINLLKWENYCEELKVINKQQQKQINKLFKEIEKHENQDER